MSEKNRLADQQVDDKGLQPIAVLPRPVQVGREASLERGAADRALLDLGVDMLDRLLEQDIDVRSPLMTLAGRLAQILATVIAKLDGGDRHRLAGAGIAGQCTRSGVKLNYSFSVRTPVKRVCPSIFGSTNNADAADPPTHAGRKRAGWKCGRLGGHAPRAGAVRPGRTDGNGTARGSSPHDVCGYGPRL